MCSSILHFFFGSHCITFGFLCFVVSFIIVRIVNFLVDILSPMYFLFLVNFVSYEKKE